MADLNSPNSHTQNQALGCLIRIYWMMAGNAVLVFSAICIATERNRSLTPVDAVFWSGVFSLIMFRYLDIQHFSGMTATGERASISDFKRYALGILIGSTLVWVFVHGLGFLTAS